MTQTERQAVIVTGAGSGLGRAAAIGLARRGCTVAVLDYNEAAGEETVVLCEAAGGEARACVANLIDPGEPEASKRAGAERRGRRDILVNNAGYAVIEGVVRSRVTGEGGLALLGWMMALSCFQVSCEYGPMCWRSSEAA